MPTTPRMRKGTFLSESTDVIVIDYHFSSLKVKFLIFVIFKAALASQRWPSCPYKPLSFQDLRHPQFLSNFQCPKFKFSVSGKKNVRLFGIMTKTSVVSSDKNVPLKPTRKMPRTSPLEAMWAKLPKKKTIILYLPSFWGFLFLLW